MNNILGLNVNSHNTSSALVSDGRILFGVEEERLTREKKTRAFPHKGIQAAFKYAGMDWPDISTVAVSVNPGIYLETLSVNQTQRARYKGEIWYSVANRLLNMRQPNLVESASQRIGLVDGSELNIQYVEHHLAHAASAFYLSPWEESAIFSVDGFGEKDCVLWGKGTGTSIEKLQTQEFPHSLGGFYATITEFLGFQPNNDEWKVMGASSYGNPDVYYDKLMSLIRLLPGGGFELDLSYFNYYQFHRSGQYAQKMTSLLGNARSEDEELDERHYDIAAAAQKVTEDVLFHSLRSLHEMTGLDRLCLVGGVALNSVANGKICSQTPFKELFLPAMPDDSGGAIGAPLYLYHHVMGKPRQVHSLSNDFGPGYSDEEVEGVLKKYKARYKKVASPAKAAAELIAGGKIVGCLQGRLEFGDRALGHRSIIADPRNASMKDKVNETVKYREGFRPFAPSIQEEHVEEYFENASPTPFMEKVLPIRPAKRDEIPAVVHVDGSGRLQTVSKKVNPQYWSLIEEFRKLTGVPLVLNTSFNLKGEPIVCSPEDALRTFSTCGLDALLMESYLVEK